MHRLIIIILINNDHIFICCSKLIIVYYCRNFFLGSQHDTRTTCFAVETLGQLYEKVKDFDIDL